MVPVDLACPTHTLPSITQLRPMYKVRSLEGWEFDPITLCFEG